MTAYTITLPIPSRWLSPNCQVATRKGRMAKAAKTKAYRKRSAFVTLQVTESTRPRWESATAQVTWYAPDARRRDKDNCLASLKAAFDGLKDAGLILDDSGLTHLPLSIAIDRENPRVEITITRA